MASQVYPTLAKVDTQAKEQPQRRNTALCWLCMLLYIENTDVDYLLQAQTFTRVWESYNYSSSNNHQAPHSLFM